MRIGACQTVEILGDVDAAIGVVEDFAGQADAAGVDLLLFPECFLQGYLVTEQHVRGQALEITSVEFGAILARLAPVRQVLVLGMIERAGDGYYNTAVVIAGGQVMGSYRKTFLTDGESMFTVGGEYPVFECGGVRFGINICYDTRFSQAAAAVAAGGARVLLVPAQNMMRRDKALWWQHRHNEIRARRARETGMWLVSADVTGERDNARVGLGPTGFLNPEGKVVAQVPAGTTGMVTTDITQPQHRTQGRSPHRRGLHERR
ncbi:carbon-nitrogen hydrolase family protein [Amorphoplanes digitatis]|uniref:carbon-nitrogen hydrolase family protein n=1 Tax=Actinoplanes digitatis TaxID=1868 RepID=UPI001614D86E|nr:carbon-nitrogen hydrolase family protein [Actinoplanes digitatis]